MNSIALVTAPQARCGCGCRLLALERDEMTGAFVPEGSRRYQCARVLLGLVPTMEQYAHVGFVG